MRYHQLTSEEPYMISALRKQGIHSAEMARNLGRHRSTISRELTRNRARYDGHYRPSIAVERTSGRRARSRKKSQFRPNDWRQVLDLPRQDWSLEQISGICVQSERCRSATRRSIGT